jgi:hypothetical protein
MAIIAELKTEKGEPIATFTVAAKEFKTGSRGFYSSAKAEINGKRYQVQIQLVEIGSKAETAGEK